MLSPLLLKSAPPRVMGALLLGAATACAMPGAEGGVADYIVTVLAGDQLRLSTPTSFKLPQELRGSSWQLRGPDGHLLPVQIGGDGSATFIIDSLPAGARMEYRLERAGPSEPGVSAEHSDGAITLNVGTRPVLTSGLNNHS